VFYDQEPYQGRAILVRFTFQASTRIRAATSRAFSADAAIRGRSIDYMQTRKKQASLPAAEVSRPRVSPSQNASRLSARNVKAAGRWAGPRRGSAIAFFCGDCRDAGLVTDSTGGP